MLYRDNGRSTGLTTAEALILTRLENEVEFLRRELERKDEQLMSLIRRVPDLEPILGTPGWPITPTNRASKGSSSSIIEEYKSPERPEKSPERRPSSSSSSRRRSRRSWLRRFFS